MGFQEAIPTGPEPSILMLSLSSCVALGKLWASGTSPARKELGSQRALAAWMLPPDSPILDESSPSWASSLMSSPLRSYDLETMVWIQPS